MSNSVILEYGFPDLGRIEVTLHKESAELYKFLTEIKQIERLEKLDHLGKVREVHKAAHYSRWEFVMRQLYFVDIIKETKKFGINSRVKLDDQYEISSGSELIKCWILLLNFSHLHGIFEAERLWLELLIENNVLYSKFRNNLPKEIITCATKIIKNENFYSLHKLMGIHMLQYLKKKRKNYPIDLWIKIITTNLLNQEMNSAIYSCKKHFYKIRKLVYVSLDINNCPFGIRFDTKLLLDHIVKNDFEYLVDNETNLEHQLDEIEELLFREVYNDPKIVQYRSEYVVSNKKQFEKLISKAKTNFTAGVNKLRQKLFYCQYNDLGGKVKYKKFKETLTRLILLPHRIFNRENVQYYTEQNILKNIAKTPNWDVFITPTAFKNQSGCIIDVLKNTDLKISDEISIYWSLLKYLKGYYEVDNDLKFIFKDLINNASYDIFYVLLNRFLSHSRKLHFKLKSEKDYFVPKIAYVDTPSSMNEILKRITVLSKAPFISKSRVSELESLIKVLKKDENKKGIRLICRCSMLIKDDNGKSFVEFDGIYFRVLKRQLHCVLIESKTGKQCQGNKAEKDLKKKINKLFNVPQNIEIINEHCYAYCDIDFGKLTII